MQKNNIFDNAISEVISRCMSCDYTDDDANNDAVYLMDIYKKHSEPVDVLDIKNKRDRNAIIYRLHMSGDYTQTELSDMFRITQPTISRILKNRGEK